MRGAPAVVMAIAVAVAAAACGHRGGGGRDDPARPGYGNVSLAGQAAAAHHLWWPLTDAEAAAVSGVPAARQGDARALLALAILASADVRDAAGVARIQGRVDQFVAAIRPAVARAADDWHRGYELHRAMHQTFFSRGGELNGYDANQPRLTGVFATGRYNCLSSALLFVVLARALDLPVRGVAVPTHVFVELGPPGARPIEIETTSEQGYGLVHDRKFFAEQAAAWSAQRGLAPLTFEDYQRREILTPARLMALAMRNDLPGATTDDDLRLAEVAGAVDIDTLEMQQNRLNAYVVEANRLRAKQAWATQARFLEHVSPALAEIGARTRDRTVHQTVTWLDWYRVDALMNAGRPDAALALFDAGVGRIDPTWPDAVTLRNNYWASFNTRLANLLDAKAFEEAERMVVGRLEACLADTACGVNAGVLHVNWAADRYNAGDGPAARQILQSCVVRLPAQLRCRELLENLERERP